MDEVWVITNDGVVCGVYKTLESAKASRQGEWLRLGNMYVQRGTLIDSSFFIEGPFGVL